MKELIINNQVVLIDDCDYEMIIKYKWTASKHGRTYYAYFTKNGKSIRMHRLIMNVTDPNIWVDHIDRNGINNCRNNLRLVTPAQSACNRSSQLKSTSKYFGVSWNTSHKCFFVQIGESGKKKYLGCYKCEEDAAKAYDKAAKEIHGAYANLNFPDLL